MAGELQKIKKGQPDNDPPVYVGVARLFTSQSPVPFLLAGAAGESVDPERLVGTEGPADSFGRWLTGPRRTEPGALQSARRFARRLASSEDSSW